MPNLPPCGVLKGIIKVCAPSLNDKINYKTFANSFRRSHLGHMSFRCATKKARPTIATDIEVNKYRLISNIFVKKYNIKPELTINKDATSIPIFPVSKRTLEKKGSNAVKILNMGDKRCITVEVAIARSRYTLPWQTIWAGTTTRCLPSNVCAFAYLRMINKFFFINIYTK